MNIEGKKYLDSNDYRRIGINKNIVVKGRSNIESLVTSPVFSKSLKEMNSKEKKEAVIHYYLNNHEISHLYEDDKDLVALSKNGIKLSINRNNDISPSVINDILMKYRMDRMNTYYNSDADYYLLSTISIARMMEYTLSKRDTCMNRIYDIPESFDDLKSMEIRLFKKDNKLSDEDLYFLDRMLEDFEDIEFYRYRRLYSKELKYIYKGTVNGKEKYIIIRQGLEELIEKIDKIIEERKECKKLQLKMEGF